jgi:oligosaccharide repeat unit polymerase
MWIAQKPDVDFVLAAFYLFVFIWMALAPLTQLVMRQGPLAYDFNVPNYVTGLLIVLAGVVAYEIGRVLARRGTSKQTVVRASTRVIVSSRYLMVSTLLGLPLVIALVYYIGGPSTLFTSRFAFSAAVFGEGDSKATGAITNAVLLVVPFVLAFLWLIAAQQWERLTPVQWLLLVACNLLNVAINNPLAQSRFWVATVYLSLAAVLFARRWSNFPRIAIAASLFFLVVLFPFSDVFRYTDGSRQFHVEDPVAQLALKGDFDAFPQLAQTIEWVQVNGLQLGHQLAGSLGFFVPRSIWADKAVDTGTLLGASAGLGNVNLSAPLWAEGYIDFGLLGTVLYLGVLGYVFARISARLGFGPASIGFSCFLGVYQFVLLRGSLLQSMGVSVAICLMLLITIRRRVPEASVPDLAHPIRRSR